MNKIDPKTWEMARQALERAVVLHLEDPNVALIDLGYRIKTSRYNRLEPELTVRVHVYEKLYGQRLNWLVEHHPDRIIRAENIGFAIDVPQAVYQIQHQRLQCRIQYSRTSFYPALCGGIAIANDLHRSFGTLGGIVCDRVTGEDLLLSCWHVLASVGNRADLAIYQPGQAPVPANLQSIGFYLRSAMSSHIDAAVACLNGSRPLSNEQLGLGAVMSTAEPVLGMKMIKSGAGTGITHGMVSGVLGHSIRHCQGKRYRFSNLVHIVPAETGRSLCGYGDSGAWWLEASSLRAVAVHFAGSKKPDFALSFAMIPVLEALEVRLANEIQTSRYHSSRTVPGKVKKRQPDDCHSQATGQLPLASKALQTESTVGGIAPAKIYSGRLSYVNETPGVWNPAGAQLKRMMFCWPIGFFWLLLVLCSFLFLSFSDPAKNWIRSSQKKLTMLENEIIAMHDLASLDSVYQEETGKIVGIIDCFNSDLPDSLQHAIANEIYTMSRKYANLDVELLCATITHETGCTWDPRVVSPAGAIGLMQIMPRTGAYLAREAGIPNENIMDILFDPIMNIQLGCRYLSMLIEVYGIDGGLAAYNGGLWQAEEWLRSGKVAGILCAETALYVPSILKIYKKFKGLRNS